MPSPPSETSDFANKKLADLCAGFHRRVVDAINSGSYAEAEPAYIQYLTLLQKSGADDAKLAFEFHNYAELLKKLSMFDQARKAESRAESFRIRALRPPVYAFKQYPLGITLGDFCKLPPPPDPEGKGAKLKMVCSCDQGQTVERLTPEDKAAGVIVCGLWKEIGTPPVLHSAYLPVGNTHCTPDFRFINDKGTYRLFEITMSFYSSSYDRFFEALEAKYGAPCDKETEKIQSESFKMWHDERFMWNNRVSTIVLAKMDNRSLERSRLRYLHDKLYQLFLRRLADANRQPTKETVHDL